MVCTCEKGEVVFCDEIFIDRLKARAGRGLEVCFLLLCLASASCSQNFPNAVLIDSMRRPTCELLWSRLDNLVAEAITTSSKGIVMIHPGSNVFENVSYERAIRNYSVFRNFPAGLIRMIRAESKGDEPNLEFWRSATVGESGKLDTPLNYVLNISSRTRLVDDSLEIIEVAGKLDYGAGECGSSFNLDVLSKILSSNPHTTAEIVIFNKTTAGARKLSAIIRKSAISDHHIPSNRLKLTLRRGGPAKEWNKRVSAVEIWISPSKRK